MSLAIPLLISVRRKGLSLVDCSSFLIMQKLKLSQAFAFGRHFKKQGFAVLGA